MLLEQNPWKTSKEVPSVLALPRQRPLAMGLWRRALADQPNRYQLVLGPRRVGKTTAMYQTVKNLIAANVPPRRLWWLRLDHPLLMKIPVGNTVKSLLQMQNATISEPIFLFLDELTYGESWDLWLKTFYDERWPVRVIGSSSATAASSRRRLESGVGRWEEQHLTPYLFSEYLDLIGHGISLSVQDNLAGTISSAVRDKIDVSGLIEHRRRFLLTGGFPELLVSGQDKPIDDAGALLNSQRTLRNDAVVKAIYQDIPQAFSIENPMLLERLLYTLAGQCTGLVSPQSICAALGLSQPTFDRYLSYLQQAYLIFTLPNYSGNETTVQRRGRKLYFVDGAIRNAALQRGIMPLADSAEMGMLLENLCASHLHALGLNSQIRLYHWRDGSDEVDFVYDDPNGPLAFEISGSSRHRRSGLRSLSEKYPRFRGRCYSVCDNLFSEAAGDGEDEIGSIPVSLFLVCVSLQAQREIEKRLTPIT